MAEQETHVIAYGGERYQVIELGSHPHAHGEAHGHERDGEVRATYRCFECGTRTIADTVDEAREKLKQKDCS